MKKFISLPLLAIFLVSGLGAQVVVNSISELQPYLDQEGVNVVMAPGVYQIVPEDVTSGLFTNPELLEFSGSNSTFDFTGVTFEVQSAVFQSFGNVNVTEVAVTGSNLVLKGLKIVDLGNKRPGRTALAVLLDGQDNRIEGFHLTVRGSYPYGYGDIFGKGSGYVIKHYKHSAVLIRGDRNHLKDTTIFHRAYGHGIFCQGSIDALIEGCYVEGEMRTTDDVLAEEGSGSPADEKDFMSVWGYRLQPGWTFCLQEDGIRAYNTGPDPEGNTRNTRNMRVIDCTVKNMRSGVTIGFCDNEKYVEGCTVLGNETGYWVGTGGEIVNCSGNAQFGPLLVNSYQNDKNSKVDLTVLDNEEIYGNPILAYIGGSNHDITFRSLNPYVSPELEIRVSGLREGVRFEEINPTYNDFSTSNLKLNNLTGYPVVMAEKSTSTTGESGGAITDLGSNNVLTPIEVDTCGGFGTLQDIDPEYACAQNDVEFVAEPSPGRSYAIFEGNGSWLRFDNFFFGFGPNRLEIDYSGGGEGIMELRLDAPDGTLIGSFPIEGTGDLNRWKSAFWDVEGIRGLGDLYLVLSGDEPSALYLDSFKLSIWLPDQEFDPNPMMVFTFTRRGEEVDVEWTAKPYVSYQVMRSTDLVSWFRDRRSIAEDGDSRKFTIKAADLANDIFFTVKSIE